MNVLADSFSSRQRGIGSLILLAFVFASMGLFARYLATSLLLFQQVYLRMLFAFVIGIFLFRKHISINHFLHLGVKDWAIIILRAVSYALFGIVLFTQAILLTKYSNVSFIGSLPTVALFGFLLLGEAFTWKKFALVMLAFSGVVLISVTDFSHLLEWGQGEILALISTVFFSISYIARRWQTKTLNNKELTVINFLFAFFAVFLVSLFKGDGLPTMGWDWQLLLALAGAGFFNVSNVFLTNYGFEKVEAVFASNILTLESLFAIVLGFLFYREVPSLREFLGGIVITLGVIGMNGAEQEEQKS